MKTKFTPWAAERVLPFPGQPWTVRDVDLRASEARIAKAGGGAVPVKPTLHGEVARAVKLRVNERYNEAGNAPKDRHGDDLVDLWVARHDVAFAIEVAIAMTKAPRASTHSSAYSLRDDGRPWGRLREHAVATGTDLAPLVKKHFGDWADGTSELPFALAFVTCDAAWIARLCKQADNGQLRYGQLCLLASVRDAKRASKLLRSCREDGARFQVDEHAIAFVPTLMTVLPDSDAAYLVEIGTECATKKIRKPWLDLVGSLTTPASKSFVKKLGA